MHSFEPLDGPDISEHLRSVTGFGGTGALAPDGIPTIELTTDPATHGPHGQVAIRSAGADTAPEPMDPSCTTGGVPRTASDVRPLVAVLRLGPRGLVSARSRDSIRFWGRFAPEAELEVSATGAVRLVARAPDGEVLAGPVMLAPAGPPLTLAW
jgi:hypothetical protein